VILIDNSQILVSHLFQMMKYNGSINVDLFRHTVLSAYLNFKNMFQQEYGELVICHDSSNVWRKDVFPHYKAKRRVANQEHNWDEMFDVMRVVKTEIEENFPYKNIKIDRAEADDIIAVLARNLATTEKIMIVSGDKDFQQLQTMSNIFQYSPVQKKMIVCDNPVAFLNEHIVRGDSVDGIPNVFSTDTSLVGPEGRQTPCTAKKMRQVISCIENYDLSDLDTATQIHYDRNKTLVDFNCIPTDIVEKILEQYRTATPPGRNKIFTYMAKHKLVKLMDSIQDF